MLVYLLILYPTREGIGNLSSKWKHAKQVLFSVT